mgnify:FL=1
MNSARHVPTLVHSGQVLTESNDITQYLDDCFALQGRGLLPTNDEDKAVMPELLVITDKPALTK